MPPTRTPKDWLLLLDQLLVQRRQPIRRYEDYYNGNHDLTFATAPYAESFGTMLESFATNWCGLVVDTPVERLAIQGFRFGPTTDADDDAWGIWQANLLDAESVKAHTEAGKLGWSYLLVSPPGEDGVPRITVEHPSQMIVAYDPADRRRRLAALKTYVDENGDAVAVVYLPDTISVFRSPRVVSNLSMLRVWVPGTVALPLAENEPETKPNPLGVVPVIAIENTPALLTGGISDLRPAVALNDAANKFFKDMIVASEFAGFPQRVLTGVELPKDPVTGQPLQSVQLQSSLKRLWAFEDADAKVFDLKPADLQNYVTAIETAVQHLAAQTRTPPHYLLAKLVNISADALKAAEAGLVAKVRRKQMDFGEAWEEALRVAFAWRAQWLQRNGGSKAAVARDLQRSQAMNAETIWRDPESRAPGVIADSLVKKAAIGVPWEKLMEEAGYSPTEIARMRPLREAEIAAQARARIAAAAAGETVTVRAPEIPDDSGV